MTIARDASSPGLNSTAENGSGTQTGTSASFSPPSNSWIYIDVFCADVNAGAPTYTTPTNTGTALSWSQVGNNHNATNGGSVVTWRAYNLNSQAGITVTAGITGSGRVAPVNPAGEMAVTVWTGCSTSQASAAATGDASASTQTINPTVTTTQTGSQVCGAINSVNQKANVTSTDSYNNFNNAGVIAGAAVYKAANSGAPGSVAINATSSAGTPWKWATLVYEILAPTGFLLPQISNQGGF